MTLDATICIGTFGAWSWGELAHRRAVPSAEALGVPVVHVHADTLAQARNAAAAKADTEWLVFLDADDELDPGYLTALARGTADLRAPAVSYVRDGRPRRPRVPQVAGHHHACTTACLPEGNWLVVGTAVRKSMLDAVGGWQDEELYEDWSLWLRCWQAGASAEAITDAVYIAHVHPDSRNRAPSRETKERWHWQIRASVLGDQAAA